VTTEEAKVMAAEEVEKEAIAEVETEAIVRAPIPSGKRRNEFCFSKSNQLKFELIFHLNIYCAH
jgi:hypothetical protein